MYVHQVRLMRPSVKFVFLPVPVEWFTLFSRDNVSALKDMVYAMVIVWIVVHVLRLIPSMVSVSVLPLTIGLMVCVELVPLVLNTIMDVRPVQ